MTADRAETVDRIMAEYMAELEYLDELVERYGI